MAQYIDKDKVIEYVKQRLIPIVTNGNTDDWERGANNERINFLSYINSLPEESASEGLEEEIERCWKEMFPIGWSDSTLLTLTYEQHKAFARHFAEWQKQNIKEALQTEYEKGRFDMREEMMKDAIECVVEDWCGDSPEITIPLNPQDFKTDDKLKIIIVKTEQQ